MKDRAASLGLNAVCASSPPAFVGFLGRDYRYESVATQIPHDPGLGLIPQDSLIC